MEESKKIINFKCCSVYDKEFMIKDVIYFNSSDNLMTFKDINGKSIIVNVNNIVYIVAEEGEDQE